MLGEGRQLSSGTLLAMWVFLPSAAGQPVSQSCSLVFLSPPAWGFACGRAVALSYISLALLVFYSAVALSSFSLFPACGGRCWPLTICTV